MKIWTAIGRYKKWRSFHSEISWYLWFICYNIYLWWSKVIDYAKRNKEKKNLTFVSILINLLKLKIIKDLFMLSIKSVFWIYITKFTKLKRL